MHQRIPLPPEIRRHHPRDIQAPTVDTPRHVAIRRHPAARDVHDVFLHPRHQVAFAILPDLRELRHLHDSVPARVAEFILRCFRIVPRPHHEPIAVGRPLLLLANIPEGEKLRAHVVEDAVHDDAHPALPRLLHQLEEQQIPRRPLPRGRILRFLRDQSQIPRRIRTEPRIDVMKTGRVVFVVGTGEKHRVQIQRVDPEILQVVELVDDALQVPAVAPFAHRPIKILPAGLLPCIPRIPVRSP